MKQELSPEHRVALIQYRFERAYKTLEEADYMRVGNYFNAAINRLYYACFYAAIGLLTYIIHSGFISGYQNRYGDNLKPPTNVYHRMTA